MWRQSSQDAAAADVLGFLHDLPLLTHSDKRGVLNLVQACLRGPGKVDSRLIAATSGDVSVWRLQEQRRRGLYRVSGMGQCPAEPQVVFELLCNTELIAEWDVLQKGVRYLSVASDPGGRCEVAYMHLIYGLPGVPTHLVADRDFVVRAVRVFFPNGMCVLFCRSVTPGELVVGDPGSLPHVIRGHMWDSGFVVAPTGDGCSCLSTTLQVDPRGWIPTAVVNLSLEAMPLNIHRIRALLAQLTPEQVGQLPLINRLQQQACKSLPAELLGRRDAVASGSGDSGGGDGCGGNASHSTSSGGVGHHWCCEDTGGAEEEQQEEQWFDAGDA